jgi:uncharacterized membrane-anchored protein YjiN (DUF445 family)
VRPKRRLALAVLLVAAATAIVAFPFRATWWGGFILAVAEAGIVGGLADWFAVTAIFRRPLGLPIPHTGIIPANWELLARRVGTMVGDRVLTREYVGREIGGLDLADLLARGALRVTRDEIEAVTRTVARWLAEELSPLSGADAVVRLRRVLQRWRLAPALAQALDLAREHGWDRRVIAALAQALSDALERPVFREAVAEAVDDLFQRYRQRVGVYPRLLLGFADLFGVIDRERIVDALRAGLRDIAHDAGHPLRRQIEDVVAGLPRRLREDPALEARVEAVKTELLNGELMTRLAEEALEGVRRGLTADLAGDESHVVDWIVDRLDEGRRRLAGDAELRAELDRWLKARAVQIVDRYHGRVAAFIENGVRALGPEGAVRLIEEHAGDDLQYIRVNGTLVGGLAGGGLYGLHLLLRML